MAKIKTSALIADIKGTVGGNVFASNKGGNYVRRGKKPTNANTEKQQVVRSLFGDMAGTWRELSESDRRSWIEGAVNFPYMDSLGEMKIYSGQQLYNKLNNNLAQAGLSLISRCPVPQSFPSVEITSIENDITSDTLNVTVGIGGAGGTTVPANFILVLSGTAPLSAGITSPSRQRFKNLLQVFDTESTVDIVLNTAYTAEFGLMIVGDTCFIGAQIINTISGEASIVTTLKSTRTN